MGTAWLLEAFSTLIRRITTGDRATDKGYSCEKNQVLACPWHAALEWLPAQVQISLYRPQDGRIQTQKWVDWLLMQQVAKETLSAQEPGSLLSDSSVGSEAQQDPLQAGLQNPCSSPMHRGIREQG